MTNDDSDAHKLIHDAVVKHAATLGRMVDYIEVGVLTGNSAEAVLSTGKVRYAILIDNFSYKEPPSSKAMLEDRLVIYSGLYDIREGDSKKILPTIVEMFDVGFVDGDHSAAGCLADMTNMLPLLRLDGIMFVHDLRNPGTMYLKEVVEHFARDNNLKMVFHGHVHNALGELTRNGVGTTHN